MVVISSLRDEGRGRLLTGTKLYLNTGNKLCNCNSDSILCIPQTIPAAKMWIWGIENRQNER